MTQLKLAGSLIAGPPSVSDGTFPASTISTPISTRENPKTYARATGILTRTEAFGSFTDLGEPGQVVKQATFLYFKSSTAIELQLTTDDGAGGDVLSIIPVDGLCILEFDSNKFLKTLEMNGSATIEYFLSGPS